MECGLGRVVQHELCTLRYERSLLLLLGFTKLRIIRPRPINNDRVERRWLGGLNCQAHRGNSLYGKDGRAM